MSTFSPNFDELSSASLVAIHNSLTALVLVGDVPPFVKKFSDKKTAVKRVTALLDRVSEQQAAAGAPPVLIEGDVARIAPAEATVELETAVTVDDKPVVEVEPGDVPEPTKPETKEPEAPVVEPTTTKAPPTVGSTKKAKDEKPAVKNVGGRPSAVGDTDVITLVHTGENPKRGMAADRFSRYVSGMTVAGYADAISTDYPRDPRRQALRDILWDMKQGWIKVVGAKQAKREAAAKDATASETMREAAAVKEAPTSALAKPEPEHSVPESSAPERQLWPSELAREGKVYNYAKAQKNGTECDFYDASGNKVFGYVVDNNGVTIVYEDADGNQTALEIIDEEQQRTLADLV